MGGQIYVRRVNSITRRTNQKNRVEYIAIPINGQQDVYLLCIEWDITKDVKNAMDDKSGWVAQSNQLIVSEMISLLFLDRHKWLNN